MERYYLKYVGKYIQGFCLKWIECRYLDKLTKLLDKDQSSPYLLGGITIN